MNLKYLLLLINIIFVYAADIITLNPKVAIITSSINKIGYGITLTYAKKGYDLILVDNTNIKYSYRVKEYLKKKYNIKVDFVNGDITLLKTRQDIYNIYDILYSNTHILSILIFNSETFINNNNNTIYNTYSDLCNKFIERVNKIDGASITSILYPGIKSQNKKFNSLLNVMKNVMEKYRRICILNNININTIMPKSVVDDNVELKLKEFIGENYVNYIIENDNIINFIKSQDIGLLTDFLSTKIGRLITCEVIKINKNVYTLEDLK